MIPITAAIAISEDELEERFIRAPGPGGQNVNKVETAVQLRFDVANSPNIPADVLARLTRLAGRRLTKEGVLVIEASRFRTREANRRDALERLVEIIARAAQKPKVRRPTRPGKAEKAKRLDAKRRRSDTKRGRASIPVSERD